MKTISIPAAVNGKNGVYNERFDLAGFFVASATGQFSVRIGNEALEAAQAGKSFGTNKGPALGRVTFENTGSNAVVITLTSYAPNSAISRPPGTTTTGATGTVNATTPAVFGTVLTGLQPGRRTIYVSNFDGGKTISVYIQPAGGSLTEVLRVFPHTTQSLDTDSIIILDCPAGNCDYGVVEVFNA